MHEESLFSSPIFNRNRIIVIKIIRITESTSYTSGCSNGDVIQQHPAATAILLWVVVPPTHLLCVRNIVFVRGGRAYDDLLFF